MNETISIHPGQTGDEIALALVGQATFLESFAGIIPGSDIIAHCANQHAPEKYRCWIEDPATCTWLASVAPDRAPVGYLVLTKPDLPLAVIGPDDTEVKRIYLLQRFQGRGVGRDLMGTALTEARRLGRKRVLLGVYSQNESAIGFYHRAGFIRVGERPFQVGANTYHDFIFALDLRHP